MCAEDAYGERVRGVAGPAVRGVLGPAEIAGFAELTAADPPEMLEVKHSDPHLIMYTSGTTGPSKGVVSPHSQGHAVGRQMASRSGYRPDDVLYTCLPVFHGNALWYTIYAALWADACVALSRGFSARRFWDEIRASGATVFNALGAMANIIWQLPESPRDRDHRVRIAMMVPTSRDLAERFDRRYGIRTTSVFAMTENCAVTVFGPDDPVAKADSAGRVRDDMEVQIVDDDRRPLPVGELGEICIRPPRARQHHARLLRDARRDRRRDHRPVVPHRRPRPPRRGRLPVLRRPQEGGDPSPRREHLRLRGGDGALPPPRPWPRPRPCRCRRSWGRTT